MFRTGMKRPSYFVYWDVPLPLDSGAQVVYTWNNISGARAEALERKNTIGKERE